MIERLFGTLPSDAHGLLSDLFQELGKPTPAQTTSELLETAKLMRLGRSLSHETNLRDLTQVCLYLLSSYVERATGSPHDLRVSGLIGDVRQDPEYNENAHKQWRYRNLPNIGKGALAEWRLADLLVGFGKAIAERQVTISP